MVHMTKARVGLAAALLLLLGGCGVVPQRATVPPDRPESEAQAKERRLKAERPKYNLAGYPPGVREGYIDGCESAKGSPYARKDARRMAADPQYEMGWKDGNAICGKKK